MHTNEETYDTSEIDGWIPYQPNYMPPMVSNAAITPQHASHKSKEKVNNKEYRKLQEFGDDLKLMFKNCYRNNQPEHDVFVIVKKLETVFDTRYVKIPIQSSVKAFRSSSTKSDFSISGSSKSSNFVEDSEEKRHNKKSTTLERRIMSLLEEVIKLSGEISVRDSNPDKIEIDFKTLKS